MPIKIFVSRPTKEKPIHRVRVRISDILPAPITFLTTTYEKEHRSNRAVWDMKKY